MAGSERRISHFSQGKGLIQEKELLNVEDTRYCKMLNEILGLVSVWHSPGTADLYS